MMEGASSVERGQEVSVDQDPALGLSHRDKMEILFAILLGLFLVALDQTIVGTALPRIVTQLKGNDLYVWVVTVYLLTSTITGPFYGKLSDLYGRRPLLMIGITLFLAGSALSGLSQDMTQLILFRGIQGLGAGALFPIALAVIGDLFTPAERGKYQGLFGAVFGISSIIGPLLGGFLTDTISWHWIFYVNIPIGLISLYVIWRILPTIKRSGAERNLDYLGALVFTLAIGILLIGLTNKSQPNPVTHTLNAWTEFSVGGFIAIGLLLSAAFVWVESRAKEPIVPLDLWRNRTYVSSMLATFFAAFGFFGAIIFLPRWFQFVRGASSTESGLQALALLAGLIVSSIVSGLIVSRTGKYKVVVLVAIATMAVGLTLMTNLKATTDLPILWLWMFITGVGIGPTLAVFTIIVQNAVPFQKLGVATANLTFFRQVGGSVGLAIVGTIFGNTFNEQLSPSLVANGIPKQFADQFSTIASGSSSVTAVGVDLGKQLATIVPPQAQPFIPNIVKGVHEAFTVAITSTFSVGIVTTVIALGAAFFMRELPLRSTLGPAPAPRPAATPGLERASATD